ncbi:hypothetical protein ATANTOWER_016308 [Ataeniobius toweri]|uniref:Uncharacterized protein n=1 Tax=Ataeniobius toweri TaxID=208326 RepID=A0ABU7BJW6_9TELE|nr:hypothetical protein [Ataeniobius toweri]
MKRRAVKLNKWSLKNNLLRPAMNHGIGWDTEDTPDPSFKSGDKKDAFVGTLEIGQHSSPHPGRYRPTNVSFKGCSPESGHSNTASTTRTPADEAPWPGNGSRGDTAAPVSSEELDLDRDLLKDKSLLS